MGTAFGQELTTLRALLTDPTLFAGLLGGVSGAAVAAVTRRVPAGVGLGLGLAAAAGILGVVAWPAAVGLAALSLSGLAQAVWGPFARTLLGGAGAVAVTLWLYRPAPAVVLLVVAVAAALALPPPPDRADHVESLMLLMTLVGIWATVPETEPAVLALGAGVVGLAIPDLRDRAPHLPTALLVLAAAGGIYRLTSLVGAACAVGLLWWPGRSGASRWVTIPLHAVLVVVGSRVIGFIGV